jgi:hypothetical protein
LFKKAQIEISHLNNEVFLHFIDKLGKSIILTISKRRRIYEKLVGKRFKKIIYIYII